MIVSLHGNGIIVTDASNNQAIVNSSGFFYNGVGFLVNDIAPEPATNGGIQNVGVNANGALINITANASPVRINNVSLGAYITGTSADVIVSNAPVYFTPGTTGTVLVFGKTEPLNSNTSQGSQTVVGLNLVYGTGTAPNAGTASSVGLAFGSRTYSQINQPGASTLAMQQSWTVHGLLTNLSIGTQYWVAFSGNTSSGASAAVTYYDQYMTVLEI